MRSLVTGGAGFIGSHVARHCLAMHHEVVVLDDLSGGFRDQVPDGARFVEGSVTDHELIARLFEENHFDYVYHLAAYAAEGLSHFIRRFNYTNNLIGSATTANSLACYACSRESGPVVTRMRCSAFRPFAFRWLGHSVSGLHPPLPGRLIAFEVLS